MQTVKQKSSWKHGTGSAKKIIAGLNLLTQNHLQQNPFPTHLPGVESSAQKVLPSTSSCFPPLILSSRSESHPRSQHNANSVQTLGSRCLSPNSFRKIPWGGRAGIGKPHAEVHGSKGDQLIELLSWRPLLDISKAVYRPSQGSVLCSLSCRINGQDHLSLDKTHNLIFFFSFWWWCLSRLPVPNDEWFCFRPIRLFEHCGGFKTSCKRGALAIFHSER